jgi:hypothetical protein
MNLTRWTRRAEVAVTAAVVVLHLVLMVLPERGEFPGLFAVAGRQALALCQPAILLAWAMLGRGRWWWRVPVAGLLFLGVALWWSEFPNPMRLENTDAMFLAFCVTCIAIFGLLRCTGMSLRGLEQHCEPRAQFSIRTLLIATTLIAAVIAVLEYLRPALAEAELQRVTTFGFPGGVITLPNETFTATTLRAIVLGVASAAIAGGALLAVLRPGAVWLRAIILAIVLPASAGYLIHLINVSDSSLTQRVAELAWAFASLAAMTAVSVLPLRLLGYRLYRPAANLQTVASRAPSKKQAPALSESAA